MSISCVPGTILGTVDPDNPKPSKSRVACPHRVDLLEAPFSAFQYFHVQELLLWNKGQLMTIVKSTSGWLNANLLQAVNTWEAETETEGQSPRLGKKNRFECLHQCSKVLLQ